MPSALVILCEGAEEMETVITVDVLRRGGVNHKENNMVFIRVKVTVVKN